MKVFTSWSIRTQLVALVCLVVAPALGILVHSGLRERREAITEAQQRLWAISDYVGDEEDRLIASTRQVLTVLSALPEIRRMDAKVAQGMLEGVAAQTANLDVLLLADAEGMTQVVVPAAEPFSLAHRDYFQRAIQLRRFLVGHHVVGRTSGRLALPLVQPILGVDGHFKGILLAGLSVKVLGTAFTNRPLFQGVTLEMLDSHGNQIYPANEAAAEMQKGDGALFSRMEQAGDGGTFVHTVAGGSRMYQVRRLGWAKVGDEGFWVRVSLPQADILGEANRRLFRNLAILGGSALIMMLVAWMAGAMIIARPIQRLETLSQRMAAGNYGIRTGLRHYRNEVGHLAQALEELGAALLVRESERDKAVDRLRDSEARFSNLVLHTPDAIFWVAVETGNTFLYKGANPAFERLTGHRESHLRGKRPEDVLPPDWAEPILKSFRRCVETGRTYCFEEARPVAEGHRVFNTQLIPLSDTDGHIHTLVGISRDVSEVRKTEENLRQTQKLESLGLLAGGIAHDFNNLLTAILGNLNLAQSHLPESSSALPFLESVQRTSLRAAELTRQMLAYSGRGRFIVKPHNVNAAVQEMAHLLEVSISKLIHIRFRLQEGLPPIQADAAQFQQVLMNLVTNAADAIGEERGVICITTRAEELDETYIASTFPTETLEPGPYVVLLVEDSGCGMSPAVMARIFDPFFTTKARGRGLGLSAMLGILRGHKAGIKVYSEVGKGSAFKLFFPATQAHLTPSDPEVCEDTVILGGLALVVDDEPEIREAAGHALIAMGFRVIHAQDGLEALEIFRARHAEITLVLMDLTMPRMDGREAFVAMRHIDPDVRIILSSGYSEQDLVQGFAGRNLSGFIQKPYQLKTLRRVVTSCMAGTD